MKTTDIISKFDLSDEEVIALTEDEMKGYIAALRYERTQFVQDIYSITNTWKEGDISVQLDTSEYHSDLENAGNALNMMIREISKPISIISEKTEEIARGEIPTPITGTYAGDFNNIVHNLNTWFNTLTLLEHDAESLSTAAAEGNLKQRLDSSQYQGDLKILIEHVNNTLDEFKKSNLPTTGQGTYESHGNLAVMEDLKRVNTEIDEGSLKAVIDEDKYSGDSRVIADFVNHLIKSLSDPLTIFATTINQTSTGKIPDRINKEYSGDLGRNCN